MRLSGRELIRTLNDYFSQSNFETEIVLMLVFPILLILLFLWFFKSSSTGDKDPFSVIPVKDMDFIETVRLQKGLEEFDRDFLIDLALSNNIRPVYQIFISQETFESVEKALLNQLKEKDGNASKNRSLNQLKELKKKLYIS